MGAVSAAVSAATLTRCLFAPALVKHPACCRFRVNMGNVYFEQGKYPSAIKNYRMALDALPPSAAYQRSRLMTNIGLAFVQLGQYADAASTFESALDMAPDHQVGVGG